MRPSPLQRAAGAAVVLSLVVVAVAFADTVGRDADAVMAGNQSSRDLGEVAPGTISNTPIAFTLACGGFEHVDPGQSVLVEIGSATVPAGGAIAMDAVTIGPVPGSWPADDADCSGSEVPLQVTGTVVITAPSTAGSHEYSVLFERTPTPAGSNDGAAIGGMTGATFFLTVVTNTPPELDLPLDMTVEGDTTNGWTAAWTVAATDAEDDPDPTPVCVPTTGDVLPLGTTTIECSATDSGGLEVAGSFDVAVVDTTPPAINGVAGDTAVVSDDPAGAIATYADPTATDVVDASPTVGCLPASGSTFAPGATTVTCTATDASGNSATATFVVSVGPEAAPPASESLPTAVFGPPIGDGGLDGHAGRTIPMKVRLMLDGTSVGEGSLILVITPCGGGDPVAEVEMEWRAGSDRWFGHWRTRGLAAGCYEVRAIHDGADVGGVEVRLSDRSSESAKTKGGRAQP